MKPIDQSAVFRETLDEREVIDAVKNMAPETVIVLPGRHASNGLIKAADTLTEMHSLKHGFESGRRAQKGVEC